MISLTLETAHEPVSGLFDPARLRGDARPKTYHYAVVDVTTDPHEVIAVRSTRKECREFIKWHEDAESLRIRRGELKLFTT
jgi:hypothetical protein